MEAATPTPKANNLVRVISLIAIVFGAQAHAQTHDDFDDPGDLFYHLLIDHDAPIDHARATVARDFGPYIAADIATYLCAPDPHPECEYSTVWSYWDYFLTGLYEGASVFPLAEKMAATDEYLAYAIEAYWCSPPAGDGCDQVQVEVKSEFVFRSEEKTRPTSKPGRQGYTGDSKLEMVKEGPRSRGDDDDNIP